MTIKWLIDVVLASVALILLAPLLLLVTLLIKLDSPGPVFFRQERMGNHDGFPHLSYGQKKKAHQEKRHENKSQFLKEESIENKG